MADGTSGSGNGYVTRREMDMLSAELHETRAWLERIDTHGTRNFGVAEAKLIDVARDLSTLAAKFEGHLEKHEQQRDRAERDRAKRRWALIAAMFAGLTAFASIYAVLLDTLQHVHK